MMSNSAKSVFHINHIDVETSSLVSMSNWYQSVPNSVKVQKEQNYRFKLKKDMDSSVKIAQNSTKMHKIIKIPNFIPSSGDLTL